MGPVFSFRTSPQEPLITRTRAACGYNHAATHTAFLHAYACGMAYDASLTLPRTYCTRTASLGRVTPHTAAPLTATPASVTIPP